jgi:hypothetical protein
MHAAKQGKLTRGPPEFREGCLKEDQPGATKPAGLDRSNPSEKEKRPFMELKNA